MLATIEHGFGLVGHHLPRISDYFRKNSPPKNDHHQPKGSQQGHDLQFFISCDQPVGFYSDEYQHKNGRYCLGIIDKRVVMRPNGIFPSLQEVHDSFFILAVALQEFKSILRSEELTS